MTRSQEIESIVLTAEEKEKAIYEAKVAKWFRERNAEYWEEKEREAKKKSSPNVVISEGK
jgi:hypothetical protein